MPRDTKFNQAWLERTDSSGNQLHKWLTQGKTDTKFQCTLCKTGDLECSNQGWSAIQQHMKTKSHIENMKALRNNSKFVFEQSKSQSSSNNGINQNNLLRLNDIRKSTALTSDEQIAKAETMWALTVARRGFSYSSCDDMGEVFRVMFPDSLIAQQFNIQSRKLSYVMSHGIGPYFHRELIKELKRNEKFSLCIDEQTNVQNKKQLDLLLKFWSHDEGLVVTRYYKSILLGHAPANVLFNAIIDSFKTDGIDLTRLLMLGRDNPSVNISLEKLINEEMNKAGGSLLFLGSCNLHIVHNGFKTGLSSANWHVENICTDIYSWFKQSPARKEDLVDVINEFDDLVEKTLLYFTITRWILLGKVVERVLSTFIDNIVFHSPIEIFCFLYLALWEPLNEYFINFLPCTQKKQIKKNEKYDKIKSNLISNVSKIRLQFVLFLCENIFDRFLTWFQQEGPLIHLLHHELSELFNLVLLQFLKSDYVAEKGGADLLNLDFKLNEKQLNNKQIRIGERARKQLTMLTQQERENFFCDVRKIYHGIAEYFKLNLPLNNSFLRDIQILHPSLRNVQNVDQIVRVARAVPSLLTDSEIDHVRNEWLTYSMEIIDEKWIIKKKERDSVGNDHFIYERIDFYWNHVLAITTTSGHPKYPTLAKLIKNILIISHGNSDVERGFSINQNIVPSNRSLLSESSINGLRTAYDAVKYAGDGCSYKVPIGKELIKAVQNSYSIYKEELAIAKAAAERLEKEKEERDSCDQIYQEVLKQEEELLVKQKSLQQQQQEVILIIADGSARLQLAIKNKDCLDINRATILIDGGNNRSKTVGDELMKVTEDLINIQRKRKEAFAKQQNNKKQKISTD